MVILQHFIVMSPIEQLGPFVSFCQACGLMPYTMEYDSTTKKFVKFQFSFKHFTTWWFILIIVLPTVIPLSISSAQKVVIKDLTANSPVTVSILFLTVLFGYFLQLLLSRWMMLFRYYRLKRAVSIARTTEKLLLLENGHTAPKSSVLRRFVIGFILIIITVRY